jgi:hypothetical protein
MSGVNKMRVSLGQANGPEVELIVTGTREYATYETPDGAPAIYDDARGLFCYARVVAGEYQSTGVAVTELVPPGVVLHAQESNEVRNRKINKLDQE